MCEEEVKRIAREQAETLVAAFKREMELTIKELREQIQDVNTKSEDNLDRLIQELNGKIESVSNRLDNLPNADLAA